MFLATSASAQQEYIHIEPLKLAVGAKAPLIGSFSDTVRAVHKLAAGDSVQAIGRAGRGHWAVVRRDGQLLMLSTRSMTPASKAAFARARGLVSIDAPIDWDTNRIALTEVVEVPGAGKALLYARAREWALANGATVAQDVPGERLVLKSALRARVKAGINAGTVAHTISLYFKDGRYKCVLTDLIHEVGPDVAAVAAGGPLETEGARITPVGGLALWQSLRRNVVEDAQARVADIRRKLSATAPAKDPADF
ncbi:hypothetical protein GCM10027048_43180 [Hymenobacter coalescens]